jgi:Lon protease-like protein
MKPDRIPLFPLNVVLFPDTRIPLHIFEPRYKIMIARCLEEPIVFGMVLSPSGGLRSVGCTAAVSQVLRTHSDGRMDVLAVGRDVFQIDRMIDEKPYFEALVQYLEDEPVSDPSFRREELLRLFRECHSRVFGEPGGSDRGDINLTYRLASTLPLDLSYKQELLEMRSEMQSRSRLIDILQEWLPRFERNARVRAKAAGNGHSQE